MTLTKLFADSLKVILNHYKFSKPPLEARIVVLEEMIEQLCIEIDDLNQRNHNDGK